MDVIPKNLHMGQSIITPLVLLVVFIAVPAVIVLLLPIPRHLGKLREIIFGVLALGSLFLWGRLVFYTHIFFK